MVKEAWIGHLYLEIDGIYWSLGCKEGEKKRREERSVEKRLMKWE